MTYSTLASQVDLGGRFPPARSIPNLPNETRSIVQNEDAYALARSTSQPAETWGRDLIVDSSLAESHFNDNSDSAKPLKVGISISTQTDASKVDLPTIEKFIVQNPRLVLNMLGIFEPTYHIECELQPQTLIAIPEADGSSPEANSPPDNQKRFAFGISNPMSVSATTTAWNSPQNSNNKNVAHCRSTDALLPTSSDDCLLQSSENLGDTGGSGGACGSGTAHTIVPIGSNAGGEAASFSIQRDGSIKTARVTPPDCSRSNSATSLSSNCSLSSPPKSLTESMQRMHPLPSISSHSRKIKARKEHSNSAGGCGSASGIGGTNNNSSTTSSCSSSNSSRKSLGAYGDQKLLPSVEYMKDDEINYDELNEKCALLCNDVRKNSISRTSITDIQKRNHLVPRPPFNHRFSAGDADKLEKGIKNIPSTRSLKDS